VGEFNQWIAQLIGAEGATAPGNSQASGPQGRSNAGERVSPGWLHRRGKLPQAANLSGSTTARGVEFDADCRDMSEPSKPETTKLSPLDQLHRAHDAKFASFAGFELPMSFDGIISEHLATRSQAGLFDVSHMGIVDLVPKSGLPLSTVIDCLETITPSSIHDLESGGLRYALLTNAQGGIIDDLIIGRENNQLRLVLNASRIAVDLEALEVAVAGHAEVTHREDLAQLALQGPLAVKVLSQFAPTVADLSFMEFAQFAIDEIDCVVSRSGYTGEDGFELVAASTDIVDLAEKLLDNHAVTSCGLGARDSLRIEAGLCLYGHELNETITPIEARLGWTIPKRRREHPTFAGAQVIMHQLSNGPRQTRVGIASLTRRPIRDGAVLRDESGLDVGVVTSGGFGPSCDAPVAMGYVERSSSDPETPLVAEVRGKEVPCRIHSLPFVQHKYKRNRGQINART